MMTFEEGKRLFFLQDYATRWKRPRENGEALHVLMGMFDCNARIAEQHRAWMEDNGLIDSGHIATPKGRFVARFAGKPKGKVGAVVSENAMKEPGSAWGFEHGFIEDSPNARRTGFVWRIARDPEELLRV